jgi:hypothetical protein
MDVVRLSQRTVSVREPSKVILCTRDEFVDRVAAEDGVDIYEAPIAIYNRRWDGRIGVYVGPSRRTAACLQTGSELRRVDKLCAQLDRGQHAGLKLSEIAGAA